MRTPAKSPYDDQVDILFKAGREKHYPKNQIIGYQGDTLTAIHLIKSGFVKAYTILDSGDTRTMFIMGPGDIFPIAFSLTLSWDSYQLKYFYQTLAETSVVVLDDEHFKHLVESEPKMANTYMSYMSATNKGIVAQLEAMKHKTAKNKILELLPYLVSKLGKQIKPGVYKLNLKLSHQEVADLSGITRETTTALLKDLEKDGVIEQQRNTWIVHLGADQDEQLLG